MKILQINAVNGILSTGRNCSEIAEYINKTDDECYTVYSDGTDTVKSIKIGGRVESKLHALMSRLMGLQGYYSRKSTLKVIRLIKDFKIDIVHLNNLHSNNINLIKLLEFLSKNNIATVVTLHDCWFYTGKCMHYTVNNCYRWKTGCSQCTRLKEGNTSWFLDRTSKMWKDKKRCFQSIPRLAVIGVSDWITNEATMSFLSQAQVIKRVYNWVDLDVFKRVDISDLKTKIRINNEHIILSVANGWSDNKGLSSIINLAKTLEDNYKIILVGNVPNIGLPKNIIHIQATNSVEELVSYYSLADVFLQMSKEETFGKVVAEALACGTPIVTNRHTANPELASEYCGIVVDTDEIGDFKKAINNIIYNKEKYSRDSCRNYAVENFNKNDCIEQYIGVYRELLSI